MHQGTVWSSLVAHTLTIVDYTIMLYVRYWGSRRSVSESSHLNFPALVDDLELVRSEIPALDKCQQITIDSHDPPGIRLEPKLVSFSQLGTLPLKSLSHVNNITGRILGFWVSFPQAVHAKKGTRFDMQAAGGARTALGGDRTANRRFHWWRHPFPMYIGYLTSLDHVQGKRRMKSKEFRTMLTMLGSWAL